MNVYDVVSFMQLQTITVGSATACCYYLRLQIIEEFSVNNNVMRKRQHSKGL